LPISYRPHVPLNVRRRPPRRSRRGSIAALLVLAPCVLAITLIDRACAAVATGRVRTVSAAPAATPAAPDKPAYAAGACRAQAPTGRSRNRTVFIDAGHGGPDPGVLGRTATGAPVKESTVALAVAVELAKALRADGYRVVLSRTGDTSVMRFAAGDVVAGTLDNPQQREDIRARVRCANDSHARALLSIHFNGFDDPSAGGSQTVYDTVRPFADDSLRLATAVQDALLQQLELEDRGVTTDDELDVPTQTDYGHFMLLGPVQAGWLDEATTMPGALVEPLFLTAPAEAAVATSSAGQRRIAQALAAGVEHFFDGSPAR